MRSSRLALISAVALLVAACSASATVKPSSETLASPVAAIPQTVQVTLSDSLHMDPATMTFRAGQVVRFEVTNTGTTNHEFYLGDEDAQMVHEGAMSGMPGMAEDESQGIGLLPGETKTLEHTFTAPGMYMAGCHVNGHYAAGMKAAITVNP